MSAVRASVWTPRRTHKLWPRTKSHKKLTYSPSISSTPYVPPPQPPPLKKPEQLRIATVPAEQLHARGDRLRAEALELEAVSDGAAPSLRIQLGMLLLSKEDYIKRILKEWDAKGKGEFIKAEFRLNLRNTGLAATSAQADELFDSWDDDRGGSLDLKELRTALLGVQKEARKWRETPNPNLMKAKGLRSRARLADEAAAATSEADSLDQELVDLSLRLQSQADVRLGALLSRRRIKPGAVVTQWSKSRGAHAGELSKVEFREAVQHLGLKEAGPYPTAHADIGERDQTTRDPLHAIVCCPDARTWPSISWAG